MASLESEYVMGAVAATSINYEVRKCINLVNSKKRNVKILRKSTLNSNEIN